MGVSPLEAALSIISGLSEKEKKQVREALGGGPAPLRPCAKTGHKYEDPEKGRKKQGGLLAMFSKTKLVCSRCGDIIYV